jgi:hypothetical protein
MTDVYGNYFIQNLIKNSNFKQINLIYNYIQKDYVQIAKNYSGTHVLQKLLDYNKIIINNNNNNLNNNINNNINNNNNYNNNNNNNINNINNINNNNNDNHNNNINNNNNYNYNNNNNNYNNNNNNNYNNNINNTNYNNNNNNLLTLEKIILSSISDKEIEMALNTNATHVLQKIILIIPEQNRQNLNEKLFSNLINLCFDSNGICLVKKLISSTKIFLNKKRIINILKTRCLEISQNQFGNYVIQFLIEEWGINFCNEIVSKIIENICKLSMQKYSSNVSEKIIELIDEKNIDYVYEKLFDTNFLLNVLKNKYGRFVLLKAVKIMRKGKKEEIRKNLMKININSNKEKNRLKNFLSCF